MSAQKNMREQLLERAREMVPALRQRSAEAAALGQLPEATITEMKAAGFFRILQPARWGGYELDPQDFFDVQVTLAEGCMSTAWVFGVVAVHNWQLALFDDRAARDVWGEDDSVLISSSYMPVGKVQRVAGGFRLSGHWGFSSGSKHCDWAFLGAMVPPEKAGDAPDYCTFLVPRSDYRIVDNWNVSGLEGTGSHDIVVEDAFVPEYRCHRSLDGYQCSSPGNAVNTAPLFKLPFGQIFVRAVASSAIGALQGALDSYLQVNRGRVGLNDGKRVQLDPVAQMAAAEARAVVDECRTLLQRDLALLMERAQTGDVPEENVRLALRFNAARISEACTKAINQLFIFSGAQGIFRDHPVNRAWLDINAGRTHVANNPWKFGRNLGGTMMGLPNEDFFI